MRDATKDHEAAVASSRHGPPSARSPASQNGAPSSRRAPPVFLTVEELAKLLRFNRKTLYDALSRGEIPGARRIGGTYRISRDAVLAWFGSAQGRVSRSRRNR
jgi:excisionase family DNA binding protein